MTPFQEQLQYLPAYLGGHLRLVLIALAAGTLVSIPLGILASRHDRLESLVVGTAGVIQTIPGLALLAIMVPLLGMIGMIPALVALTLYSLLPILRNTVVGLREIDDNIMEAGRGLGMSDGQLLRMVQVPLALPVIVAGLRTSAVWVVGIATLSTPVGATSLGNYIFSGLQTRNNTAILFGCVAAAALALVLDAIIHGAETGLREGKKWRTGFAAAGGVAVIVLALLLGTGGAGQQTGDRTALRIGGKPFTEQYILMNFLSDWMSRTNTFRTRQVTNLGSTVAFDALRQNQIDLYVDYSGTLWNMEVKNSGMPADPDSLRRRLAQILRQRYGVTIGATLGFENAYCLAMRSAQARQLGIESIRDLSPHAPDLVMGGDVEFFGRPEWPRLKSTYHLNFRATRTMDAVLMYSAVRDGQVDVISAYTTDGRIAAYNLKILQDPEHVFPPYDAVVLLSPAAVRDSALVRRVRQLDHTIDADLMRRMNMRVDQQRESPEQVGKELYRRILQNTTGEAG